MDFGYLNFMLLYMCVCVCNVLKMFKKHTMRSHYHV